MTDQYDSVALLKSLVQAGLKAKAPEIEYDKFVASDCDTLENEINEFYNLTEKSTFYDAQQIFVAKFPNETWKTKSKNGKRGFVLALLESLEVVHANEQATLKAYLGPAQSLLYLLQGAFLECESTKEQLEQIEANGKLVFECGGLPILINAFSLILRVVQKSKLNSPEQWYDQMLVYLALLHFVIITNSNDEALTYELAHHRNKGKPLIALLFEYLTIFGDKNYEYFPLKKVLLLIWRTLLATLGGTATQLQLMNYARKQQGLPPVRTEIYTKSTEEDLERFDAEVASHFYGMNPAFNEKENGNTSLVDSLLATLPVPILEGHMTLKRNIYVPLSKVQLKAFEAELLEKAGQGGVKPKPVVEEEEEDDEDSLNLEDFKQLRQSRSEEALFALQIGHMNYIYKQFHQEIARYLIIFLKVLLAAVPSVKKYTGTINLGAELKANPRSRGEMKSAYMESLQENFESLRHKEIISKAISAILLLLLKHSKITHFLQHEYLGQVLVEANCILLILKFLNQDMAAYCTQQNELEDAKFLVQCMKKDPDAKVSSDPGDVSKTFVSWRNTFAVINLMRVLQKLTKRKPSRISVLIQYKAPGILKRVVKLPHGDISYYALKLLKSQLPYLGRKWQTTNMRTVSSIMYDLRSRYSEANLLSNIPEEEDDSFMEDSDYSNLIEAYNQIYCNDFQSHQYLSEDDLTNDLSKVQLEKDFEQNYQQWLDQEVFEDEPTRVRPASPTYSEDD